jgi:hypothetical protein
MAKQRQVSLVWPAKGLDKVAAYEKQPPSSTPDALNVWTDDRSESRERGGSRPGIGKAYATLLGSGNPIFLLESVQYVTSGGAQTTQLIASSNGKLYYESGPDMLEATSSVALATTPMTGQNFFQKLYIGDNGANVSGSDGIVTGTSFTTAAGTDLSSINANDHCIVLEDGGTSATEDVQSLSASGTPTGGTFVLTFQDFSTGNIPYNARAAAIQTELEALPTIGPGNVVCTGSTLTSGPIKIAFQGDLSDTLLQSVVADGTDLKGGTDEVQRITVSGGPDGGTFALQVTIESKTETTTDLAHSATAAQVLEALRALTNITDADDVATSGGALPGSTIDVTFQNNLGSRDISAMAIYRSALTSGDGGDSAAISTVTPGAGLTLAISRLTVGGQEGAVVGNYEISSVSGSTVTLKNNPAKSGAKSGISWRAERTVKVYDPDDNSITGLFPTYGKGIAPSNCIIVASWRGRLMCVERSDPYNIKMSRVFNPKDWDYNQTDVARAIQGNFTYAGGVGEPITAIVPFHQNCLIIGCRNSIWSLNGDPGGGGAAKRIDHEIGMLDSRAWCIIRGGYLLMMTKDGLYIMPPGCGAPPTSVSREFLPTELLNIDASVYEVSMAYDLRFRGVHLFLYNGTNTSHWFIDVHTKATGNTFAAAFWPVAYTADHSPAACHPRPGYTGTDSPVVFGSKDGYMRNLQIGLDQDDGSTIASYIVFGPFALGSTGGEIEGKLSSISAVLGRNSGSVTWSVHVGQTAEDAVNASARESGAWTGHTDAGLQYKAHPRARGAFACIKISSTGT